MHILEPISARDTIITKLAKLNIYNYWDLALHIPLRYEDLTQIYPISKLRVGQEGMVQGKIIGYEIVHKKSKQLLVRLDDGSALITLMFFHFFPNYAKQYEAGKEIRAYGEIKKDYWGNKMIIHPKIQTVTESINLSDSFSPIYPTTNGLANAEFIRLIDSLLDRDIIPETIPQPILNAHRLLGLKEALLTLHKLTPEQFAHNYQDQALQRLKFDELIAQQLLMQKIYATKHQNSAPQLKTTNKYLIPLMAKLPFKLTQAQHRVLHEILTDITEPYQMNRLLQGDVGSGKTIVATISCLVAIENYYQAVIMAPTEILAEQHYLKTCALLDGLGINILWLSGSLTPKQKKDAAAKCADGSAQLIIGTHAVFQKNVEFKKLGFVVIDEQHRFGVDQRLALVNKIHQDIHPHQLMMSATPIPRSLAMSYYADLDVSNIDELPPGRTPIETLLIKNTRRYEVIKFVRDVANLGQQVYWVCPLIEESEKLELENAINTYNELSISLAPLKIGLIHGKMKPKDKAQIMAEFSSNNIQVLVATTVIEVGVDVPNASIMAIEHSERMGLAQLHQLRGRVGRGTNKSQCILLYENNLSEIAKERLRVISTSTDGFEIARQDLLIRGPGELLGQRQSGLPELRFANLEEDIVILHKSRGIAKELAAKYPDDAKRLVELWFHNKQIYSGV